MSNKKPFHIYWHNPTVLVFKFDNLGTIASKMWGEQCLKYNGQMPNPLRILYDFVDCGPPSPYWMKNQDTILRQLILPENHRSCYLIPDDEYRVWTGMVLNRTPIDVGTLRSFTIKEQAIAWLMEGI